MDNHHLNGTGVPAVLEPSRGQRSSSSGQSISYADNSSGWSESPRAEVESQENFDPLSVFHSLRRHWPVALLTGLLLAPPMAVVGWFLLAPKDTAMAYLRIDSVDSLLVFQTADRLNAGRDSFSMYKNTQAQLIKTPFVLNEALAVPEVRDLPEIKEKPSPLQWLSESLRVEFPGKGEVMTIALETEDPKASTIIVDAVVKAYMNEAVLDERNERMQRVNSLEEVYAEAEGKVRARRAEIRKLADTLGTGDSESLSIAQQLSVERYGHVQTELGKVNFDLMRTQGEVEAYQQLSERMRRQAELIATELESRAKANAADSEEGEEDQESSVLTAYETDRILSSDRDYQSLLAMARSLEEEIELYKTRYGKGMIQYKIDRFDRLTSDAKEREATLLKLAAEEKGRKIAQGEMGQIDLSLSPEDQKLAQRHARLLADAEEHDKRIVARGIQVGILQQQKERIEHDLVELDSEAKKLGRSSIDIEMMRAEIASLDDVLNRLGSEIERTRIELNSGSRVAVISEATPVADSSSKKRYVGTAGLGFIGFCLPFLGFIGLDLTKKRVNSVSGVGRELSVPILGSVPRHRKIHEVLTNENFSDCEFGNSVSSIVAMLVNMSRFDRASVLMVTSGVSGEGKTTLATSLWRGLTQASYRTILIDFDLRRPSLHENLGYELGVGVSDAVGGNVDWKDAVHATSPNAFFMTAGSSRPVNLSAVGAKTLPQLFSELRAEYDFVIVDTPPVLPVVDTRVIGEHVDAAVLSVMKDKSRIPQVVAAHETLKAHGVPVMGVVVSGCPSKNGEYLYQY
ncbi:exopolysaccharide transport family protein [Allorhodopirellula heiligendammensis]|uniref:Tyrosine-protein kinase YwqD n=1 Tax=Allorhodopirellula heiligendammensis TaxID=2714739 RepID=A0A5C6C1R5_9BACT|nr:polysaccharide biosynthesis tyrosine autokinase [Allorhodopirellula heiligendammensis]TWU18092.1 Tyrosine-protein kinase YwqD [Allorhodopirellula heiligendammensis]